MRNSILYRTTLSIGVFSLVVNSASAQLATYDAAVHRQTQQVTQHTSEILKSSSEIQKQTEAILKAVSGTRGDAQSIANAALGGSFNFGQAPAFSDVLGGGAMNWGQLNDDIQKTASALINGLRLVKSLSGKEGMANNSSTQAAYESAIGLTTSLVGIVSGSQTAVTQRSRQFQNIAGEIGKTQDIKGSIDFNTQMQLQTAQTTNEAIGAITAISAAEQSRLMQSLAEESGSADLLRYKRTRQ